MNSLTKILHYDWSYPGIEVRLEIDILQDYLVIVESSMREVSQKYIEAEKAKSSGSEFEEFSHIYLMAEEEIPRIVRNPIFVSLHTLLESALYRLLDYARSKEGTGASFRKVKGRDSLLVKANRYMESELGYTFRFTDTQIDEVYHIAKIRNFIVHENAHLDSMTNAVDLALMRCDEGGHITSTNLGQMCVSSHYLGIVHNLVRAVLEDLMQYMENRYFTSAT